jgi:hypothetical protein
MCNLYSVTKGQSAILEFTRAMRDAASQRNGQYKSKEAQSLRMTSSETSAMP